MFYFGNPYMLHSHFCHHHHCHGNMFDKMLGFSLLSSMVNNMFRRTTLPQLQPVSIYNNNYNQPLYNQPAYNMVDYASIFRSNYTAVNTQPVINEVVQAVDYSNIFRNTYNSYKPTSTVQNTVSAQSVTQNAPISPQSPASAKILGPAFLNRVKQIANNLNCDYRDLLAVINSESGFDPTARNGNVAVGLIQFTQSSISELNQKLGLNLTKEKILKMSAMEQLDLAEKYLKIAKSYKFAANHRLSAGELYAITFLPGRADRETLCIEGERDSKGRLLNYYEANAPFDYNGDKRITKSELERKLNEKRVNESVFA